MLVFTPRTRNSSSARFIRRAASMNRRPGCTDLHEQRVVKRRDDPARVTAGPPSVRMPSPPTER